MKQIIGVLVLISLSSCIEQNPNTATEALVASQSLHYVDTTAIDSTYEQHKVYVPIYSNIYQGSRAEKVQLTATLSIRNTSEIDSLFLKRVDYFNTQGDMVRQYLKNDVYLDPLETIEYVVEQRDTLGGSGANFMVTWYGKEHLTPVIESVMIGGLASRTFSFTTQGTAVSE